MCFRKLGVSRKTSANKFSSSSEGVLPQHTGISFPPSSTPVTDAPKADSNCPYYSPQLVQEAKNSVTQCMQRGIEIKLGKPSE